MRRLIFISIVCAFLTAPAMADIRIRVTDSVGGTNGGEFIATVLEDPIGYLYDNTPPNNTFGTFCVETNEYLNYGGTYYVDLSTYAVKGGVGGGTFPPGDPLDDRTAWIYKQWLTGMPHTVANADLVQRAIWYIEGETGGVNNSLVAAAQVAVAAGWRNYDIMVMNLYGDQARTQYVQDLLVMVPLPGAVLLGFLGLSVARLKLRRFA